MSKFTTFNSLDDIEKFFLIMFYSGDILLFLCFVTEVRGSVQSQYDVNHVLLYHV